MIRFNCSSVKYRCFDLGSFPRFSSSHDIQTFRPSTSLITPTIFRIDLLESLYVLMTEPFGFFISNVCRRRSATHSWTAFSVTCSTSSSPNRGRMCFVRWGHEHVDRGMQYYE